jgi:23S rRNA (adenine2030-N6)-methyltransferase
VNYRHAFHAGNFADVHKHVVLLALIERLKHKPKPVFYLDTHAGRGDYDLHSQDAMRGGEWREGIARLRGIQPHSEDLARYMRAVAAFGESRYPGSPILAIEALRETDRAVLVEQQAIEAQTLKQAIQGKRGVAVICGDGYAALKSHLPPRENRGLVLIDPPYEADSEFADVGQALQLGLNRWPNGVFAAWYPIKAGAQSQRLHAMLKAAGLRKLLRVELTVRPADSPVGLNGSGLIIANPPWQFDVEMESALAELHAALAGAGRSQVEWLIRE